MKNFKLTLKEKDDKELSPMFVKSIMKRLYQDFELINDPDSCNCELGEMLTMRQLKDLSVFVNGSDLPSVVKALGELILVGANRKDDNCPNCGYPDFYYTGGRMLCDQCEYSEQAEDDNYLEGNITDFSGFVTL